MRGPFEEESEYEGTLDYERAREGSSAYRVNDVIKDDYDPESSNYYSEDTDIRYASDVLGLNDFEEDD